MAKKNIYFCTECKETVMRWTARCPKCKTMGSIETTEESTTDEARERAGLKSSKAVKPSRKALTIDELKSKPLERVNTGINEFDRVIGGGFVKGQMILFAGEPGSGKSTLCLSIAEKMASKGNTVLYSSGEESEQQIGLRAQRMSISNPKIKIINETNLETLLGHIETVKPTFVIVDSLQTLASSEIPGSIGSITQGKESANTLHRVGKSNGITMILINQILKSGEFSGSESVLHIVDTALMLESDTESPLKFLRSMKNRFGDISEVGVFQHSDKGLDEVDDPSGIFLESNEDGITGAACSFLTEGLRQIPIEVQALVTKSTLPTPRKQFNGVEYARGQIVAAILDKFCNSKLYENDVFVSTVSGIRVKDPQSDLAIAASILSSLNNVPLKSEEVFIGEISLTGQVRGAFMLENKLKEASRLGFTKAYVPYNGFNMIKRKINDINVIPIKSIKELNYHLNKSK